MKRREFFARLFGSVGIAAAALCVGATNTRRDHASVRDFGARGDGVTDDTDAFQRALCGAKSVYVPPGRTFKILGSIDLMGHRLYGVKRPFPDRSGSVLFAPKDLRFSGGGAVENLTVITRLDA
jgi:hypothetical protein